MGRVKFFLSVMTVALLAVLSFLGTASAGVPVQPLPWPGSLLLLSLGLGGLAWWLRKHR